MRGVDIHSPDCLHHLCEILRGKACSEGGIYRRDKLCIRLFCCETAHQLFYKSVVIGKIRERQHIEHLCLFHSCRKTGGEHGILDGIHGIFHCLQLSLFLGRQIFNHHGLQAIRVDLDSAVKKADHGDDGHDDDYQHAEHPPIVLSAFLSVSNATAIFLRAAATVALIVRPPCRTVLPYSPVR